LAGDRSDDVGAYSLDMPNSLLAGATAMRPLHTRVVSVARTRYP